MKAILQSAGHCSKNFAYIDSLNLPEILWGKYHYYLHLHFINEKTKEQKLKELAQDHEQLGGWTNIQI